MNEHLDTPWMIGAAFYEAKGVHELRGAEDPDIIRFFAEIGHPEFNEDEIAWCAGFVGACLWESDQGHCGTAWAPDYMKWVGADRVTEPRYGDIAVTMQHVTFFAGDNGNGTFKALGGNQGNRVCYMPMSYAGVIFMRPNGKGTPKLPPGHKSPWADLIAA